MDYFTNRSLEAILCYGSRREDCKGGKTRNTVQVARMGLAPAQVGVYQVTIPAEKQKNRHYGRF